MNRFWELVLAPTLEALEPRCIIEVGAAKGALTAKLLEWAAEHDAVVHSIDPRPAFDLASWRKRYGKRLVFHKSRSLDVLGRIENVDAAFIDGDHNWYTVIGELRLLERTALAAGRLAPLIGLHDVDWPYGRRDLYYNPKSIPAAHRQPYELKGILLEQDELSHDGLNDHLNNATREDSTHNGVRTAIEDFLSESQLGWKLHCIPGLHGVGILLTGERLTASPRLSALVNSLASERFLRSWCGTVERARIHAEIAIAAHRECERKLVQRAAQLRGELERLERQLELAAGTEAELRRELVLARTQVEEADELRRAAQQIAGVAGDSGDPALANTGAVWSGLASALQSFEETVSTTLDERDPMFEGDREAYLAVSRSALGAIVHALAAAGIAGPRAILDLPCGYGRVTRALQAAWPSADLVAADQSSAAVAFCVEQFAAQGWALENYPTPERDEERLERFDLIWSGSLLSSIEPAQIDAWLSWLLAMLHPDGVLVAAYHGRDSTRRFVEQSDDGLRALAEAVAATGVGFRGHHANGAVGTTAMTSPWLLERITRHRTATVLSVSERGWADHLDVVAIANRDVHHRQRDIRPA